MVVDALTSSSYGKCSDEAVKQDLSVPFSDLFQPVIAAARLLRDSKLGNSTRLLSDQAHANLEHNLLTRLSEISTPALLEGFSIFRILKQPMMSAFAFLEGTSKTNEEYKLFIMQLRSGKIRELFLVRPVIARLISVIIDQWIEGTTELIQRLNEDIALIAERLNAGELPWSVCEIDYGISDPHNRGRMVSIITFSGGFKVVYKPKDLRIDCAWLKLIDWLSDREAPASAKAPKTIKRNGYGWSEWIKATPYRTREEVRRFFERAGALLCLVHVLQGTNVHFKNIIACCEEPCLIDLETLFHPWMADSVGTSDHKSSQSAAWQILRNSVLATGYLPY